VIGDESIHSFSRRCELSEATLRGYLRGVSYPTIDRLNKIAITANTSMTWLIGEDAAIAMASHSAGSEKQTADSFMDEYVLLPGYRVQVSAGHGAVMADGEEPCRFLAFRRKWLAWRGFSEKDLVIVWCKGDSMEPAIYNNDTLVVHTGQTRPVDGGIYVLRNHDQLWVKRIQTQPNAWLLHSDNPHYSTMTIPKDEQHNFQVVGKVVHISHDVN